MDWRELLYPLGYIAQVAFGLRFLQQWIESERQHKSVVTKSFWILSLLGNSLLLIHALIQLQFHLCIIQICNAVISWRNLNLMQDKSKQVNLLTVIYSMLGLSLFTCFLFILQGTTSPERGVEWLRLPTWNGKITQPVSFLWHLFGICGLILFSSRFWLQWIGAEKKQQSYLGPAFWWISIVGACCTITYAIRIQDPVNVIGPALGLIPYIRNMMLIYSADKRTS